MHEQKRFYVWMVRALGNARLTVTYLAKSLNMHSHIDNRMARVVAFSCVTAWALGRPLFAQPQLPDYSAATFRNSLQIDNRYWPMVPGTTWTYEGVATDADTGETETEMILVEVLSDTRSVLGVETRIVRDRVYLEGLLIEDTFDWYAQDDAGNVWYMGEEVTDLSTMTRAIWSGSAIRGNGKRALTARCPDTS